MLLIDMESATRGYIATGDESFLQPYLDGQKRLDPEYQALYEMVDGNLPQQQQRLKEIHASYMDWEEYASTIISLRRAGKADPTLYENQQGKRRMDAIRAQILQFQNVEAGLRVENVQAAYTRWTVMVTSFIGLGLGVGVFLALFTRYNVEKLGTKLLQSEERWTATLGSIGEAVIATDSEEIGRASCR